MLKDGYFAQNVEVGTINKDVYGALAASAINALWIQDGVFIIKITDAAYGKGTGKACKIFPDLTACIDGVAYIFVRSQVYTGEPVTNLRERYNWQKWFVFGASSQGSGGDGTPNTPHLADYGLDTTVIAKASEKTQRAHGFLYDNQNGDTIDHLIQAPTDLAKENLMFFNLPICDIDAIIGSGKHLGPPYDSVGEEAPDDPIAHWGYCTCQQVHGWPADKGYVVDASDGVVNYTPEECRELGWVSN